MAEESAASKSKVIIYLDDDWRDEWPLSELTQWLQSKLQQVPEQYRDSAKIEIENIDFTNGYGDFSCLSVQIYYYAHDEAKGAE